MFRSFLIVGGKPALTKEIAIERCTRIHNGFYSYLDFKYINNCTKMPIVCPLHGMFKQVYHRHSSGSNCPKCAHKITADSSRITTKEFVGRANKAHGGFYGYAKSVYINAKTKIEIDCPVHGPFLQLPHSHLRGSVCIKCKHDKFREERVSNTKEFKTKCKKKWGDLYDLSKVVYGRIAKDKVIIGCRELNHGYFSISANSFLMGSGCPKCSSSEGEKVIRDFYIAKGMVIEEEKTFEGCKYRRSLFFDFYVPSLKLLIEYDGGHHFKPIKWYGGRKGFNLIKKRDAIKTQWAKDNGYRLLRIKYTDFNRIEEILDAELKSIKSIKKQAKTLKF
jgi:very-short-patch-repair endonuclease